MTDFEKLVGDVAERYMASRSRVRRDEIVDNVVESLVLDVLKRDPRFVTVGGGGFFELAARREQNELARRRKEAADAEASHEGEWLEPSRPLEPYGVPFGDAA